MQRRKPSNASSQRGELSVNKKSIERVGVVSDLLDRHYVVSAVGVASALGVRRHVARDLLYQMQLVGLVVSAPLATGAYTRPMSAPRMVAGCSAGDQTQTHTEDIKNGRTD